MFSNPVREYQVGKLFSSFATRCQVHQEKFFNAISVIFFNQVETAGEGVKNPGINCLSFEPTIPRFLLSDIHHFDPQSKYITMKASKVQSSLFNTASSSSLSPSPSSSPCSASSWWAQSKAEWWWRGCKPKQAPTTGSWQTLRIVTRLVLVLFT